MTVVGLASASFFTDTLAKQYNFIPANLDWVLFYLSLVLLGVIVFPHVVDHVEEWWFERKGRRVKV